MWNIIEQYIQKFSNNSVPKEHYEHSVQPSVVSDMQDILESQYANMVSIGASTATYMTYDGPKYINVWYIVPCSIQWAFTIILFIY